uniref:Uncharacterized protein n=1 Tax=Caenorhabditis japonica TaxID=281687 RepID=A0A8R1HVX1_CAEJA
MSRHPPLVTKKEIIYRRSFIDDHNDRFDNIIRNPMAYVSPPRRAEPERSTRNVVVNHNYPSDTEYEHQLSKINKKLENILEILRTPSTPPPPHPPAAHYNKIQRIPEERYEVVDNERQQQTRQYKDICERLEKLESELTGKSHSLAPFQEQILALTKKIHELALVQEDLASKLTANNMAGEDIDELLKVINETRRDLEEKIGNIRQLSDGNYIHLEDKLDGYLRNQHGIQLQVDHLLHLLTHSSQPGSVTASRPHSAAGRNIVSRSSSRSSHIKANLVYPTARSPPPKSPSEASYASSAHPKSEKSASQKSSSTVVSSNTIASSKKKAPIVPIEPKAPVVNHNHNYEVLEKTKSIETLNALYYAQKANGSEVSSSSGSFIAPLKVDERRNSQPATIFLTKKV